MQLHYRTLQPAILFQAVESVMKMNNDKVGSNAMVVFFERNDKTLELTTKELKIKTTTLENLKGRKQKLKLKDTEIIFLKLLIRFVQVGEEEKEKVNSKD